MEKDHTDDFEEAIDIFDIPVNCGECYCYYDAAENNLCPVCGSDEVVGDR